MVIQEQIDDSASNAILPSENAIVGEDHVPKIRKPYTITKQRERWTEEEHKKFLEALKLHGRAWRKIEEHVGSKTAVQIRSHAQKFFSKVSRETTNTNTSSVEPIEIPPPRPKRKPSHPYPRKLVLPSKKESPMDQLARSTSPNSTLSQQENRSPTSVLSAAASDTLACADSASPDGSSSPMSSANIVNQAGPLACEDDAPEEDGRVSGSVVDDHFSVKLELFPNLETSEQDESASVKILKLFGKDVVVPSKPTDGSTCLSKSPSSDMGEGVMQMSQESHLSLDIAVGSTDDSWNQSCYADGNVNQVEKPVPLPWWVFFKGVAVSPFGCQHENAQEKESQGEGSCAGSSSESVNAVGNSDRSWDVDTQSGHYALQSCNEGKSSEESNPEKKRGLLEKKTRIRGFVPYKRCFSERDMQSSTITSDEKEAQRIRLCL